MHRTDILLPTQHRQPMVSPTVAVRASTPQATSGFMRMVQEINVTWIEEFPRWTTFLGTEVDDN